MYVVTMEWKIVGKHHLIANRSTESSLTMCST